MARREKYLQSGMSSMMGYATQTEQNQPMDNNPGQESAVQDALQDPSDQDGSNEKKKTKYLRLDITGLEDYVSLMAEYLTNASGGHISMTKYIRQLIESDKQQNSELFEKLKQIENMKQELI